MGIGRDPNNPSSIIKLQPIQTYRNNDGQNGISLVCGGAPNADPGEEYCATRKCISSGCFV